MRYVTMTAVAAALLLSSLAYAGQAPDGIAAQFPGDKGIGRHPSVILHEDFEGGSFDRKRWSEISNKAGALTLTREPENVHSGRQAVQMTATLGKNTGGHLFTRFGQGYEKLHARFCVKFAKDCGYIHHFVGMTGEYPPKPWPSGGAGLKPGGDRKFSASIEPWSHWEKCPPPGGWHFYCYWWQMPLSGDGKYWGQGFAKQAYAVPERGKWYCVEFMVKCNKPGKPDGEIAVWIDGVQLAHHKGINWRSSPRLQLNSFNLMLYVTDRWTKQPVNTCWFDDAVVATEYIGPPVKAQ